MIQQPATTLCLKHHVYYYSLQHNIKRSTFRFTVMSTFTPLLLCSFAARIIIGWSTGKASSCDDCVMVDRLRLYAIVQPIICSGHQQSRPTALFTCQVDRCRREFIQGFIQAPLGRNSPRNSLVRFVAASRSQWLQWSNALQSFKCRHNIVQYDSPGAFG